VRLKIKHETVGALFDLVYLTLMTNFLLAAGCVPLVAGLLVTDPVRSWPLLALAAPLCAPAVCAAFAVLADYSGTRSTAVVRTFARAWRVTWRRAVNLGALATGAVVILGVDIRAAWGRPVGAAAIPVLGVLMVLVAATTLLALVILAERPAVRVRDAARASVYLAVRHWYLTAVSFGVLIVLEILFTSRPAIALGLAATPLLYVVWANSRFALRAALGPSPHLTHKKA
jgi:uncharacterized membrane protein YesL